MSELFPENPDEMFMQKCNEAAEAKTLLASASKRMASLLVSVGDSRLCKGCDRTIFWIRHKNGKPTPYDADGTNHFATCPVAYRFKRPTEANRDVE